MDGSFSDRNNEHGTALDKVLDHFYHIHVVQAGNTLCGSVGCSSKTLFNPLPTNDAYTCMRHELP